jgi:hypothetical protein
MEASPTRSSSAAASLSPVKINGAGHRLQVLIQLGFNTIDSEVLRRLRS